MLTLMISYLFLCLIQHTVLWVSISFPLDSR